MFNIKTKIRRARPRHQEDTMQICLMRFLQNVHYGSHRISEVIYHVPNGGKRNAFEGARFKQMGVRAGVADLHLPIPIKSFHGAFFELKATTQQTESQKTFAKLVYEFDYYYSVHWTWEDCARDIIGYLRNGDLQLDVRAKIQ